MTVSMAFTLLFVALVGFTEVSADNSRYIDLKSFDAGGCVQAFYSAPSTGRTAVQLFNADGDIVLSIGYRKDWGSNPSTGEPWQNIIILNSQLGGSWGTEQHVEDVRTTPGTEMALEVCAQDADFSIVLNKKEMATYAYRTPVNTVSRVAHNDQGSDSVPRKICASYSA